MDTDKSCTGEENKDSRLSRPQPGTSLELGATNQGASRSESDQNRTSGYQGSHPNRRSPSPHPNPPRYFSGQFTGSHARLRRLIGESFRKRMGENFKMHAGKGSLFTLTRIIHGKKIAVFINDETSLPTGRFLCCKKLCGYEKSWSRGDGVGWQEGEMRMRRHVTTRHRDWRRDPYRSMTAREEEQTPMESPQADWNAERWTEMRRHYQEGNTDSDLLPTLMAPTSPVITTP